jgi:para-nitrobenzyl esterase
MFDLAMEQNLTPLRGLPSHETPDSNHERQASDKKRAAARVGALLGILLALAASPVLAAPTAETTLGVADGIVMHDGVQAWLGLPYAAPPIGPLRWKPPQPASTWTAPFAADHFGPSCMQPLRDHGIAYYVGDDPVAEDCLTLNVWAPAQAHPGARLPVIVYIHGGSFVAGSARKPLYVGDQLAARGAVVIGINYRLGALGFLALPELTLESAEHASGNYGLMDQIAALRWIKANAAAFGGDPERITLMGQSAGAMSIAMLQTSPAAKGLFERIAALSGSVYSSETTDRVQTLAAAEAEGERLREKLGAADLAALRRMPPDRIVAAQPPTTLPNIDGSVMTASPAEVYAAHYQTDVPLLLGTVEDEALGALTSVDTLARYRTALATLSPRHADAAFSLYPAASDAAVSIAARTLAHDMGFSTMMRSWARMQVRSGTAPVYAYRFDRKHPYRPGVVFSDIDPQITGVNHTDDVPYWLGTFASLNGPRITRDWTAQDRALGEQMQSALIAFAAGGDPNPAALGARWARYDKVGERVMLFADKPNMTRWARTDKLNALAALGIPDPRTDRQAAGKVAR